MNRPRIILWYAVAGALAILTLSASTFVAGGGMNTQRTISVTGTGKVTLKPDLATINVGVHTENENVAAALSENNAKAQSVRDALAAQGVKPEDIQTISFTVYPSQVYGPMGEVQGTKYLVDNAVYITVRDLNGLGAVLTNLVEKGANNIYGITFDVADRESAVDQARQAAIANARLQAEDLAAAAGVAIGQVLSISTTSPAPVIPAYAQYGYGGGGGAGVPAPIASGQLVVSVDAYLTYELK